MSGLDLDSVAVEEAIRVGDPIVVLHAWGRLAFSRGIQASWSDAPASELGIRERAAAVADRGEAWLASQLGLTR